MKTIILPLIICIIAACVAQYFFSVDVEDLAEGFFDFAVNILKGPKS